MKPWLVQLDCSELWEKPFEEIDWREMKLRSLVDAVLSFAEASRGDSV